MNETRTTVMRGLGRALSWGGVAVLISGLIASEWWMTDSGVPVLPERTITMVVVALPTLVFVLALIRQPQRWARFESLVIWALILLWLVPLGISLASPGSGFEDLHMMTLTRPAVIGLIMAMVGRRFAGSPAIAK